MRQEVISSVAGYFRSRWRSEWDGRTDLARLGREFRKVLRFLEDVPSKRAALAAEGTLSRKGLDEAARSHFASAVVPDLRRAAWEAERSINAIATRRKTSCCRV